MNSTNFPCAEENIDMLAVMEVIPNAEKRRVEREKEAEIWRRKNNIRNEAKERAWSSGPQ